MGIGESVAARLPFGRITAEQAAFRGQWLVQTVDAHRTTRDHAAAQQQQPDKMSLMDQTMKKTTAQKSSAFARLTDLQLASLFFSV